MDLGLENNQRKINTFIYRDTEQLLKREKVRKKPFTLQITFDEIPI